jgi:ATP-binding cassette subfamily F protein uup
MSTILAATDLVVRYNERMILDGATLGLDEGDRVGLVGRNGCGKTTFLKILAGLQTPDSGEVTARRELVVSYLPQDFTLEASLDVRGNVRRGAWRTQGLIAEFESLPAASKRHEELERRIQALDGWTLDQRVETAMSHLNCPPGERRIGSLSGGEQRRVALARAIVSHDHLDLEEARQAAKQALAEAG